jgi:hypothetical protein
LNRKPNITQLGSKLIKSEGDDMVKVEDMGVTRQGKKKTQKKNPRKTTQNVKMS